MIYILVDWRLHPVSGCVLCVPAGGEVVGGVAEQQGGEVDAVDGGAAPVRQADRAPPQDLVCGPALRSRQGHVVGTNLVQNSLVVLQQEKYSHH